MTKETKIGLLVGLAFIIIVGILLGDSVRHATDVQPAQLPQVAQNVRDAVTTPGVAIAPPISLQAHGGLQNVTPQQTVLTREEVSRPVGSGVVVVGPGSSPPIRIADEPRPNEIAIDLNDNAQPRNPLRTGSGGTPPITLADNRTTSDQLREIARQHGQELIPLNEKSTGRPAPDNSAPTSHYGKTYQAGPGDSLGKIAAKFYGSSAKPLRDAIVAANPSLKQNPDRILSGQIYTIPAIETAAITAVPTPAPAPAPAQPLPASRGGTGAVNPPEYFYTVKENDNLWRIARDQVGDASAVPALKELNKDVLKGGETVRVNMKLRLPGKPAAN
jgi:nucleoid-associated protein YgaU